MKHFLLTMLLVAAVQISFSQNILIADNNAGAPSGAHVYSDLQAAIDAATPGDIIHVIPSPTDYGSVTVSTDDLSIFGIGFNPDKDGPAKSSLNGSFDVLSIHASDIRISGLVLRTVEIGASALAINNISIENSSIAYLATETNTNFSGSNILVRNCLFRSSSASGVTVFLSNRISNSVITNCVITGYNNTGTGNGTITAYNGGIIKNTLFLGDGESNKKAFETLENCTVSNCIFYGRSPQARLSVTNTVFNNNVSVGSIDDTLPPSITNGVTGNNNFESLVDPSLVFEDPAVVIGDSWDLNWDPIPSATNAPELFDSGTDGTNIGPTGSTIPWDPTGVPLPLIQSVISSEVIKQGDNMDVTIKARGN